LKAIVLKQKSIFRKKNHIASAAGKWRLPFAAAEAGLIDNSPAVFKVYQLVKK
jgi:hypothetical protein